MRLPAGRGRKLQNCGAAASVSSLSATAELLKAGRAAAVLGKFKMMLVMSVSAGTRTKYAAGSTTLRPGTWAPGSSKRLFGPRLTRLPTLFADAKSSQGGDQRPGCKVPTGRLVPRCTPFSFCTSGSTVKAFWQQNALNNASQKA